MAVRFEIYRFDGRKTAAASALKLKIVILMMHFENNRLYFESVAPCYKTDCSGQQNKPTHLLSCQQGGSSLHRGVRAGWCYNIYCSLRFWLLITQWHHLLLRKPRDRRLWGLYDHISDTNSDWHIQAGSQCKKYSLSVKNYSNEQSCTKKSWFVTQTTDKHADNTCDTTCSRLCIGFRQRKRGHVSLLHLIDSIQLRVTGNNSQFSFEMTAHLNCVKRVSYLGVHRTCVCKSQRLCNLEIKYKGAKKKTLWEINIFSFLMRVRWEDPNQSHVLM